MKRTILLSTILLAGFICLAQNGTLILHPLVGDSITQNDKTKYLLFPEISDNDFSYGKIIKTEQNYFLNYLNTNNELLSVQLDSIDLLQYHLNIIKLNAYFTNKTDTINNFEELLVPTADLDLNQLNIQLINPQRLSNLSYEARRHQNLRYQAIDNGLWGDEVERYIQTSGYIEFYFDR